jgi:hypothetical protein
MVVAVAEQDLSQRQDRRLRSIGRIELVAVR